MTLCWLFHKWGKWYPLTKDGNVIIRCCKRCQKLKVKYA